MQNIPVKKNISAFQRFLYGSRMVLSGFHVEIRAFNVEEN